MRMSEVIRPISYVKAHAAEIIAEVAKSHQHVIITQNGEAKAILQSVSDFEQMQETMAMLKILALSQANVAEGKTKPLRKAFRDIRRKVRASREGS